MYKVSVIIPIYNVERYLPACLDSAVNQTLEDIEIICVDDGSSDNSAAIAAEYAQRHDNIRLIRQENSGPSIARNAGLDIAAGEYVFFLDSDDCLYLHALETLYRTASEGRLDILFFNADVEFDTEQLRQSRTADLTYTSRPGDYSGVCTGQTMFARMQKDGKFLAMIWIQFYRRAFLEENRLRFYPGILLEDSLFSFQSAMLAQRTDYIPDRLYLYKMREASIVTSPRTIRHVEGHVVSYCESLYFLRGIAVQEDVQASLDRYLYCSLFQNACKSWGALSDEERKKPLPTGRADAKQLLELVKQTANREAKMDRLKDAGQKLRALEKEKYNRPAERIRRFFRSVKEHGLLHAVRSGVWKLRRKFARFMSTRTRGTTQVFYTLAVKEGYRYARQEVRKLREADRLQKLVKKGGKTPLVSFIVPVYNAEPYLQQSLDCLLEQTMERIEIICIDDGSTDSSLEILRRYAQKDSRVQILTQQNRFAGVARNHGLSKAKGEYVVFLDADDFFEKTLAEDAYLAAKAVEADVLLFDAAYYDNITGQIQTYRWLLDRGHIPKKRPFNRSDCPDSLFQLTIPCPWTKMFRRQFVLDTGLQFQALRNANDIYFACTTLAMAERITVLDKVLVYYRTNVSTSLQATKAKDPLCFYEALKAVHGKLKELGLLEQLRRSFVNSALNECIGYWSRQKDPAAKQAVEEALRRYIFWELELTGYEASYYRMKEHYEAMQAIVGT